MKKAKKAGSRSKLRKVTDDSFTVRSGSVLQGVLREEVWVDEQDRVVKYNLAYIHPQLCQTDNGRVIGYDNAHGFHERHRMGHAERVPFRSYAATSKAFYEEVDKWRKKP